MWAIRLILSEEYASSDGKGCCFQTLPLFYEIYTTGFYTKQASAKTSLRIRQPRCKKARVNFSVRSIHGMIEADSAMQKWQTSCFQMLKSDTVLPPETCRKKEPIMDERKEKLRQRMQDTRAELLALIETLTAERAAAPSGNPGWTVQDVVAHLAGAEGGHRQVIRGLLAEPPRHFPRDFDLDAFNAAEVGARRGQTLNALQAELDSQRAETLALLDSITDDQWERAGYHPGGFDTTVEGVFRVIAIHEKRHVKELRAALDMS
ncbi:MAG: DinB family protein [Anaerolineae bacterium]